MRFILGICFKVIILIIVDKNLLFLMEVYLMDLYFVLFIYYWKIIGWDEIIIEIVFFFLIFNIVDFRFNLIILYSEKFWVWNCRYWSIIKFNSYDL